MYVRPLQEVDRWDVALVGGKAAWLGELARRSYPVPRGFAVTTAAFRAFYDANPQLQDPQSSNAPLTEPCAHLDSAAFRIPADVQAAVGREVKRLLGLGRHSSRLAVRSSSVLEDTEGWSGAGQFDSFLNVRPEDVDFYLLRCWLSALNSINGRHGAPQSSGETLPSMGVVVQECIPADAAGVLFTRDPSDPTRAHMLVEALWGLGVTVVGGRTPPDRFQIDRWSFRVTERTLAEKKKRAILDPEHPGEWALEEVPRLLRRTPCLTGLQLRRLARVGRAVEADLGAPQDIEFAWRQGRLILLQTRPLGQRGDRPPAGVWVLFKPIAEVLPEPMTPMTASVLNDILTRWSRAELGFTVPMDSEMGGPVLGRPCVNLSFFQRFVYGYQYSLEEVAQIFDFNLDIGHSGIYPKLGRHLIPILPSSLLFALYLLRIYSRTRRFDLDRLSAYRTRAAHVEEDGLSPFIQKVHLLFDFDPGIPLELKPLSLNMSGHLSSLFYDWLRTLLRRVLGEEGERLAATLVAADGDSLSFRINRRIWELACEARRSPKVSELLLRTPEEEVEEALATLPEGLPFRNGVQSFLDEFGHRGFMELELRHPRWRERPSFVHGVVRNFLSDRDDPALQMSKLRHQFHEDQRRVYGLLRELRGETLLPWRTWLVKRLVCGARHYLRIREQSRFAYAKGFDVLRKLLLQLGRQAVRAGLLRDEEEIFYLTLNEVEPVLAGRFPPQYVQALVQNRKALHQVQATARLPALIGLPSDEPTRRDPFLKGFRASPGVYVGRARVVRDPSTDCRLEPGDVLVAPYAEPAWTPLFSQAGALVVEASSALSHAAIVAREYGLPAVVDVAGCMQKIRDGQTIKVDADQGRVYLLDP